MKLFSLLSIIIYFNSSLQKYQQAVSTIESLSSQDIEDTTPQSESFTTKNTTQTSNSISKITPISKIRNQCLTVPQFEGLYPEYAENTLKQRFNTEIPIGEGSFGKVITANFKKNEIVIKKVKLPNETYTFIVSQELEYLKTLQGPHLLKFYLCVYDESISTVYILTEKLYNDLENLQPELKKKKKVNAWSYT